jgi:hypothetical protein
MSNTYDETILINLNSKDAIKNNGSFLSDVYFNFKNIIKDMDDVLEIQVTVSNAQIPYSFYNVNVYNNVLAGTYNATPFTLTLTRGNYNATNLISEIQTQFTNAGITGTTITISNITGTLQITVSSGTLILTSNGSTIYKVLGLENGIDYTAPFTAPYPLNLLGTLRLRICSYELITYNLDSTNMTSLNVLATVPIEAPTFGVILYDNITNIKTRLNNNQLDGFDILILDDDNNPINFNNVNWCCSVLIVLTKERKDKNKNDFFDYVKILGAIQNQQDNQAEPDVQAEPEQQAERPEGVGDFIDAPEQQVEPDIQGNITDDNSLDLLLYNNGINPTTGTLTGV